jgi:hypothetical protein
MTENQKNERTEMSGTAAPSGTQPKINWDDSNMRSVYANVCNVAGTREEIVLLFGMHQAWHSAQKEVTIKLEDRVVLSPFAAKRLMLLLNNVIKNYENRYGSMDVEARRPTDAPMQ